MARQPKTSGLTYRVVECGTGADAAEWRTVGTFESLQDASRWLFENYDTDNPEVPLRVDRKAGPLWMDALTVLPAGIGSAKEWELRELRAVACRIIEELRRVCCLDSLTRAEAESFASALDVLEGGLCSNLSPTENPDDAETLRAFGQFRKALLGPGLTDEEREVFAGEGGFLDQLEAHALAVLS